MCGTKMGRLSKVADAFDPSVSWTSGDDSVATVANGTVTGVGGGDVYIIVKTTDGEFKDSCYVTVITGISNTEVPGFKLYPNPANNLLTIETDKPEHLSIEIITLNGQLMYTSRMEGSLQQIDLSSFQRGLYFITVRSRDYVRTEKVIKL